uniref:Uncharacterized protein n=1 Tax=Moniliophthora roreri TaxID=221103 RepID=A0A0W0FEQ7_MONRR
MEVNAKVPIHP